MDELQNSDHYLHGVFNKAASPIRVGAQVTANYFLATPVLISGLKKTALRLQAAMKHFEFGTGPGSSRSTDTNKMSQNKTTTLIEETYNSQINSIGLKRKRFTLNQRTITAFSIVCSWPEATDK